MKIFLWFFLIFSPFLWFFPSENPDSKPDIVAMGDIMISRSVGAMTKKYGTNYITNSYNPISDVRNGSFVIANLESPFSHNDRDSHEHSFYFASNPQNISILNWLMQNQIPIISLANNHIFNAGFDGFRTTIQLLDENNILHTGLSLGENRGKFLEIIQNNHKYCFGAYSYDGQKYFDKKTNETWWVNSLSDAEIDILEMNNNSCDEKIFILHWGAEYRYTPSSNQIKLAHFLIDNGATMIIGGHSHIFGKTEIYKQKPIFYSLGNAIFDQEWGRKGCELNMDCIEINNKKVVPTHIGTAIKLKYPYIDFSFWQWEIEFWKMKKFNL